MGPADIAFQQFSFFPEFLAWIIFFCVAGLVALILGAVWMYRDAQSRHMDATVWVILLIVAGLAVPLVGFFIVLIIYLVVRESHPVGGPVAYGYGYGYGYPPTAPPAGVGAPSVPASCPVCGNPMTWVAQYARWYCATCAQYR